jgi:hypothetical protein
MKKYPFLKLDSWLELMLKVLYNNLHNKKYEYSPLEPYVEKEICISQSSYRSVSKVQKFPCIQQIQVTFVMTEISGIARLKDASHFGLQVGEVWSPPYIFTFIYHMFLISLYYCN